jgi:surface antigen
MIRSSSKRAPAPRLKRFSLVGAAALIALAFTAGTAHAATSSSTAARPSYAATSDNVSTATNLSFSLDTPSVDAGSDDYPWSPLCTYGECGAGKVACSTGNGYCGDPWGMAYGQCVSFVAWKIYEIYGGAQRPSTPQGTQNQNWRPTDPGVNGDPVNSNWGDGGNWANAAASAKITPTQTPAAGDVAEWNANSKGMGSSGHVMMVVAVSPGNYITVAGYNTHLDGSYGEWNIPWDDNNWSGSSPYAPPWPDNFLPIHP